MFPSADLITASGERPLAFQLKEILRKFQNEAQTGVCQHGFRIEVLRGLGKNEVGMCDLGELQGATNQEYVLLVRQDPHERILIRGTQHRCWIPPEFPKKDFLWYAHSHPYNDPTPSGDDRLALGEIQTYNNQKCSVVVPESRDCEDFTRTEDLSDYTGYEPSNLSNLWEEHLEG